MHILRIGAGSLFLNKKNKAPTQMCGSFGRGRRTRTLNNGFGDRDVTITLCPYLVYMVGL